MVKTFFLFGKIILQLKKEGYKISSLNPHIVITDTDKRNQTISQLFQNLLITINQASYSPYIKIKSHAYSRTSPKFQDYSDLSDSNLITFSLKIHSGMSPFIEVCNTLPKKMREDFQCKFDPPIDLSNY